MSVKPENHPFEQLLQTKLEIPNPTARVLRRTRLTSLFERPGERKVTVLIAPAGYGKTTLLGEWLSISSAPNRRTSWVTLDIFDNAPFRFWSYFIAALKKTVPSLKFSEDSLLAQGFDLTTTINLNPLLNEIDNLPFFLNIILDDYHVITDPIINLSLSYLIEHQPKNVHLVISSRTRPEIPMARLRTLGRLIEIESEDLAFSFEETRKYLNDSIKRKLSPKEIIEIFENTEGWIAGLQMIAITHESLREMQVNRLLDINGNATFPEYFSEEVLVNKSPEIQDFLLKTSLLSEFSASLCDYLLEKKDSQKAIDYIISHNLFIEPIDIQNSWYRYHPLFARSMMQQFQKKDPASVQLLHKRALNWFLDNNLPEKAVIHALQSGQEEKAAEIIDAIAMQAIINFDLIKLIHWINAIPDTLLSLRPKLGIYYAVACFMLGLSDLSRISLAKVETLLGNSMTLGIDDNEYETIKWIIGAVRAGIDIISGDRSKGVTDGLLLLKDKSKANNYVFGLLSHFIGVGLESQGLLHSAINAYEAARNYGLTHNFYYGYFHSSVSMAHVFLKQGQLTKAKQEFNNALEFAVELNLENATISLAQTGLLEIALQQNNLDVLDSLAQEILVNFDKTIFSESVQVNHIERCVFLANYFVKKNDLKNAREFFERALSSHRDYSVVGSALPYDIVDTYLRIIRAEARKNEVKEWHSLASDFLDPVTMKTPEGMIMQASIFFNQGKFFVAKDLLNNLVKELRQSEYGGHLAKALVLYAIALFETSEKENAFLILEEVLQSASLNGFVRDFLEEGDLIKSMICEYIKLERSRTFEIRNPGFLDNITMMLEFECAQKSDKNISLEPVMTSLHFLKEPLSDREKEILRMLLVGRSAKEIAELLMVSINTTKTHIKNIYRKFGVHSQKMLIEKAIELGYKV